MSISLFILGFIHRGIGLLHSCFDFGIFWDRVQWKIHAATLHAVCKFYGTSQGNDSAYGLSVLFTSKKDVHELWYTVPDWLG